MKNIFQPLIEYYLQIKQAVSATWWFVFPVALYYTFFELYWRQLCRDYSSTVKWTLLEVRPPRNVERSPRTMEQVFAILHGIWSTPNYFDMYFTGRFFQSIFAFEIQGVGGEMHFYVRTESRYRNLVEAAIYAQYPEAEIEEVEDYVNSVPNNIPNPEWDIWGTDFKLAKDDAYPLRTYHKFQEDVTKGMIETWGPLADVIASVPPNHHVWLQLLIRPVKDSDWAPEVKKVVNKLAGREDKKEPWLVIKFFEGLVGLIINAISGIFGEIPEAKKEKKEEQPLQFRLTPIEKDVLQAVEESLSKKAFRTKVRMIYVAPRESFDRVFISAVNGFLHQFNDPNLNSLENANETKTFANYWFRDYRLKWAQRKIFRRYITRDNDGPNMYLNTEELATLWHLPDMSAVSPAIARVEAKKGGAPLNLPVE